MFLDFSSVFVRCPISGFTFDFTSGFTFDFTSGFTFDFTSGFTFKISVSDFGTARDCLLFDGFDVEQI